MNGVILTGDLLAADGTERTVRIFLDYEDGTIYARQTYGGRGQVLSLKASEVVRAVSTLKTEWLASEPAVDEEPTP